MYPSIGQQFREARERKGMSLAEAAEITRIKPTQISAMEQGDFRSMAAPLYVKGFIRIYAKTLGLDPGPIIETVMGSPESEGPGVSPLAPENTTRMLHTRHAPSTALAPPVDRFAPPGEEGSSVVSPPAPVGPRTRSTVHAPLKPAPAPVAPRPATPAPVSVTARKLSDAQRALNVPRVTAPPAPIPEPARGASADFDFPSLAVPEASGVKAPAAPPEPDLFSYRPPAPPPPEPAPAAIETPAPRIVTPAVEPIPEAPVPPPEPRPSIVPPAATRTTQVLARVKGRFRFRREWLAIYGPPVAVAIVLLIAVTVMISAFRSCASSRAEKSPALASDAPSGYAAEPPEPFLPLGPAPSSSRAP